MSRVIVFGASGLLGASLVPALRVMGHTVITQDRGEMTNPSINPSDPASVIDSFIKHRPDVVVNLIAATNVDQCETHPQIAWKANAEIVGNLANAIILVNEKLMIRPHLIQISTDQVYGGDGPHCEDNVQPVNVYGLSKYSGELLAMRVAATVLRTNFFGKSRHTARVSLSDWLVAKLRDLNSITVFDDVMFSAIHIDSLCWIIARCIELCPVGIFNVGCRDSMSKADFAFNLANVLNLPTDNVTIGSVNDVALTARRPLDMRLKVSRLENMLDLQFPSMLDEIHRTAMEYQNG